MGSPPAPLVGARPAHTMDNAQGTKQAEFKLRDTCNHIEGGEKAALIVFSVICLLAWSLITWWYVDGVDSRERLHTNN